jgi:general secretion pathway protein C
MVIDCARVAALSLRDNRLRQDPPGSRPFTARSSALDLRPIVEAHLFGIAAAPSPDRETVRPARADLQLHGTFATVDPRHGWAIVTVDGAEKLYETGETAGGAALSSVYADHVLLNRDGQLESLWLPRASPPARLAAADEGAQAAPARAQAHRLADIMRAEPEQDEDSQKLIGFRVKPVAPASGLLRAGLRPYDVVTAVNGSSLTDQDPQRSRQMLDAAMASGNATMTVLRGGQHVDVAVDVGQ